MSVLLTTFPAHRSGNVGDALIASSAVAMIKARLPDYAPRVLFREADLDELGVRPGTPIVAPGFSVAERSYPHLYRLHADLDQLSHFYPLGCSLQTNLSADAVWDDVCYSDSTRGLLQRMAARFGAFPCRDSLIVDILHRNGIPAVNCGDLAQYDETRVDRPLAAWQAPKSIAFTVGHHPPYADQAFELLTMLKDAFPDAVLKVAFHSRPSAHALRLGEAAVSMGCELLHLYGDVEKLSCYDDVDLHVGYRLHGHISFLRRRKPSLLLIEDVRSFGFSKNPGAGATCLPAFTGRVLQPDPHAPATLMELLNHHIDRRFVAYADWLAWSDETYHRVISPYFNNLARNLAVACQAKTPALVALP